jgi:hypothetical protein
VTVCRPDKPAAACDAPNGTHFPTGAGHPPLPAGHGRVDAQTMSTTPNWRTWSTLTKTGLTLLGVGILLTLIGNPVFGDGNRTAATIAHYAQLGSLAVGLLTVAAAAVNRLAHRKAVAR